VTRVVLTEAAEQACDDIRLLQAQHVRASNGRHHPPSGRTPGFEPTVVERTRQLTLTTIVAVAEHFSAGRLRLVPGVSENDTFGWPNQEKAWKDRAQLELGTLPTYSAFRGFNEARNAIMHGRGALTPRQLDPSNAAKTRAWLTAALIKTVRHRLIIVDADVDRCADVCVSFVQQLDKAAP
jgi:hypothetical protein